MLESSLHIATVRGIRIGVHYTWLIIFFLLSSSLLTLFQDSHPEWTTMTAMLTATVTTLLFFLSIILHELGHSLVAIARGIRVQSITLFIFGGVAQTERESPTAATEFWIAIAGPAVSVCLAGVFYLLGTWLAPFGDAVTEACSWLARINFILAVFNMIPGFPLDGGRVFRALVWMATGNAMKGMQWAVFGGKMFAYFLMIMGLFSVLTTGMLINGLWFIGIGWFLLSAAEASGRAYVLGHLGKGVTIKDVMQTDLPVMDGHVSVYDWIHDGVLVTNQRAYMVSEHGRYSGLVTLSDTNKITREQWAELALHQVMTPLKYLYTVKATSTISDVMTLMQQYSLNQVPVVEHGQIIGWIDRQRLLRVMQVHGEVAG